MQEEWRDIIGYEGLYQVSNFGRVRSLPHWQVYQNGHKHYYKGCIRKLAKSQGKNGYLHVRLGAKGRQTYVHILVAEAFLDKPDGKTEVNHIDGDKTNNNVDNLEWCTRAENMHHCAHVSGKYTGIAKIRIECSETGEIFDSLTEASKKKGVNLGHLSEVIRGNRNMAGGYHWKRLS